MELETGTPERSRLADPYWEWQTWLVSFAVLPFIPALSGILILVLTVRVVWRSRASLSRDRDLRLLLVWVGLLIASVIGAIDPGQALLGSFNFIPFVAMFAAMSQVFVTLDRLRQLAWTIVLPSILVGAIGLGELFWGWSNAGFPAWLTTGDQNWRIVAGGTPPGRMSSVFLHANFLAAYGVLVFALTLGLLCEAFTPKSSIKTTLQVQTLSKPTTLRPLPPFNLSSRQQRIILGLTIAADLVILAFTSSRNAWGIACLILLAFLIYRHWWRLVAAIHAGIAIVLAAAFAPDAIAQPFRAIVPYAIWGRLSDQMYPDRPIASLRLTQWHHALEMVRDRPFGGWGLQSFSPLYESRHDFFVGHPHNLYLMLAAETGTIATLLLIVIVGGIIVRSAIYFVRGDIPSEARSLVFAYTIALLAISGVHVLDIPLFQAQVNLLGWVLLASLAGIKFTHPTSASS